jgi:hypothetical protein
MGGMTRSIKRSAAVGANNSTQSGQTRVLFCYDPDQDGCLDERVLSQVAIGWVPAAG